MPWLMTVLGALVSQVFTLIYRFFAYKIARNIAIGSAFIVISGGMIVAMSSWIKLALMGVRVMMPPALAAYTYFLPSTINLFISVFIMTRIYHFVWRWSMRNFSKYCGQVFI